MNDKQRDEHFKGLISLAVIGITVTMVGGALEWTWLIVLGVLILGAGFAIWALNVGHTRD